MKVLLILSLIAVIELSTASQAQLPPANPTEPTAKLWVALVIEHTKSVDPSVRETIAKGMARHSTRAEAVKLALTTCRGRSQNPTNCRLQSTFNESCKYAAIGYLPWGKTTWAEGTTPQKAYDACHAAGFNCDVAVSGGCAVPSDDIPLKGVVPARALPYWFAIAGGRRNDEKNKYLVNTYKTGPTKNVAEQRALYACNNYIPDANLSCQVVGSFNLGCGYISRAYESPNNDLLGWATGHTPSEAYNNCVALGYSCREAVGGCIKE